MIQQLKHYARLVVHSFLLLVSFFQVKMLANEFDTGKTGFKIKFRDVICPYRVMSVFMLPDEKLELEVVDPHRQDIFELKALSGKRIMNKKDRWLWSAPAKPGRYPVTILHSQTQDSISLNIFVMATFNEIKDNHFKGCFIGKYPASFSKNHKNYKTPAGFIEVTQENATTWITPHFQLKQFLCKQSGDYPKYAVLEERLLLKLELILETLNKKGIPCRTLTIMSGYRTPYYNEAIGNVKFSRHIYGAAADFYIDESPQDGMMDDINHDGQIDLQDAKVIYNHIEALSNEPFFKLFQGGLAAYKATASHGPFLHVDVRGYRARW